MNAPDQNVAVDSNADAVEQADESNSSQAAEQPTHVVGIGASAGGLEALERLFENLQTDLGMAFVVIQHLSPDFKSLMDELLGRRTEMPIHRAENEMRLLANKVYLLPPRKEMIVSDGALFLTDKSDRGLTLPIDHFFRSLGQEYRSKSIGIVLSGTGSDGSRGIEDISAAGGLVIAQTERTAKFDGMPNAARATGRVDVSLDPEDIPAALKHFSDTRDIETVVGQFESVTADEDDLTAIFHLLRDQHGIDFSHYKLNTVVRRTERRLQLNRIDSVKDYLERLRNDPDELDALYRDLLVGVTKFFRDEEAFSRLGEEIDELLKAREAGSELRVWVAGCATGEEAFSIAILVDERMKALGKDIEVRIFATDAHRSLLNVAGTGIYSNESIDSITPDRLVTYFSRTEDGYQVNKSIRQSVVFAPHNVIKDAPFTRMDLITCRNMLIYFQPPAQKKVLSLFHFGLKTGGILMLGPSESTGELEEEFDVLDSHWNIFRKQRDVRLTTELRDPIQMSRGALRTSGLPEIQKPSGRTLDGRLAGAYDALLQTHMPPGLLIDSRNRLLHVFSSASQYLRQPEGRVSDDVLDRLDPRLRLPLTAAIRQALVSGDPVRLRAIRLSRLDESVSVNLSVSPVRNRRVDEVDLFIAFEEDKIELPPDTDELIDGDLTDREQISSLELELSHAKENMQALIEELETSNEELQATNEELVASNEELQSTNEELHSVNEELYTVNAEHQRKIQQLTELTDDMTNLFESTQVHTVFLDKKLRIRRYTPEMARVFHLIPDDIGRPIESFRARLKHEALVDDLRKVLDTGNDTETEICDDHGRWFLMRIRPYETEQGIQGVVLTLIDIEALRRERENLRNVIDHSPTAKVGVDEDGVIVLLNDRLLETFGYARSELIGKPLKILIPDGFRRANIHQKHEEARDPDHREMVTEKEYFGVHKDGQRFPIEIALSSIEMDSKPLLLVAIVDISRRKQMEIEIRAREAELRLVTDNAPMMISYVDSDLIYQYVNREYERFFGVPAAQIIGKKIEEMIGKEAFKIAESHHRRALQGEITDYEVSLDDHPDGKRYARAYLVPHVDDDGTVRGFYAAVSDVTGSTKLALGLNQQVQQRDEFLAALSHELRNPMAAIMSATTLLEKTAEEDSKVAQPCAVISRQSSHISKLLDDLLDVSRVTQRKIELTLQPTDLIEICRESLEAAQPMILQREHQIEFTPGDQSIWVNADHVRLVQTIENLLTNAIKYTPDGGLIELRLTKEGDSAVIRLKDNGYGMTDDMLGRAFDLFVQSDQTLARSEGGMGVGLTLVRSLVELHHGTIEVVSDGPGCGCEFVVHIPLSEERDNAKEPAQRSIALEGLRIVLVEDNSDARAMMIQLLSLEGNEVVASAEDGESGYEAILRHRPDVAILDIGLPKMDGYELARRIRKELADEVRLIALTGYGRDEDRKAVAGAGFEDHLVKPISLGQLQVALQNI